MQTLHCDIETFSSVDIKKSGMHKYIASPDFEILLFAYALDEGAVNIIDLTKNTIPHEVLQALSDPNVIKHAFNAPFEWHSLNKFWYSPLDQWHCTMFHSLYCGFTSSLASATVAIGLGEDKQKMSIGNALIKTFCTPTKPTRGNGGRTRTFPHHEPEKWELFKEYCKQDVVAEMAISDKLKNFPLPDIEQSYWVLDQIMNTTGIRVDMDLVEGALKVSDSSTQALMNEAVLLTGLSNPKSVQQLSRWLTAEMGEDVTDLTKANVKKMLGDAVPDSVVARVLAIRLELAKTSVKKYQAILNSVNYDGRVRGLLQFYGANKTGRSAGRLIQVQNLPRNYLKELDLARELVKQNKTDMLGLVFGNVPDTLSQLIRTSFIPSEGYQLVIADFSAIEARVLAWLAGEKWVMDVFAGDGKIYEKTAAEMFKLPVETIVKGHENYKYRAYGKVAVLACGYGGSVGALVAMGALGMGIPETELQGIVDKWRQTNPKIVEFWYALQNAVIRCIKTGQGARVGYIEVNKVADFNARLCFLTLGLPSGRKLYYATPHIATNKWGGDSIGYYGMNQETKKWSKIETYSGKLVENCTQAVARDCLFVAIERVYSAGYRPLFSVHDEIICEGQAEDLKNICAIMGSPIPWAQGLFLPAEGFVSKYYKKDG